MLNSYKEKFSKRAESLNIQLCVVVAMIAIIVVSMSATIPGFASIYNLKSMINNYIPEGIVALGMTLIIMSGGIDLSIAGTMPFSAILFCLLMKAGIHYGLAIILVLLIAAIIGFIINLLRDILGTHPFVVTMAAQLTLKGINLVITGGGAISALPANFNKFAKTEIFGIQLTLVIFIVLAFVWLVMMKKSRYFRQVYFIGGNPKSAELSGINVKGYMRFLFMQSSILAGIAGIVAVMKFQAASYSYGLNLETRVITAVVIGGTSMISGGIGTIGGTLFGLLFVALVYNSFLLSGISTYYQDIVTGSLLIIAILSSEKLKDINKNRRVKK